MPGKRNGPHLILQTGMRLLKQGTRIPEPSSSEPISPNESLTVWPHTKYLIISINSYENGNPTIKIAKWLIPDSLTRCTDDSLFINQVTKRRPFI